MGGRGTNLQSDRPESGGAQRTAANAGTDAREHDKSTFATSAAKTARDDEHGAGHQGHGSGSPRSSDGAEMQAADANGSGNAATTESRHHPSRTPWMSAFDHGAEELRGDTGPWAPRRSRESGTTDRASARRYSDPTRTG
jgi:hypothetical protein